jgi:hypothetical protein
MQTVIAELYGVFKPYRLGDDFSGCSHCVSERETRALAAIPLRTLSAADLNRYSFKAMTTWGTERHFKHFLPRLLELAAEDLLQLEFPETLFGKLAYAKWRSWTRKERDALQSYLEAFWPRQLNHPFCSPGDERVSVALGCLAQVCDSLQPFLDVWQAQQSESAAHHMAQLITYGGYEVMTSGIYPLWDLSKPHGREVAQWLATPAPQQILQAQAVAMEQHFPEVFWMLDGIRAAVLAARPT